VGFEPTTRCLYLCLLNVTLEKKNRVVFCLFAINIFWLLKLLLKKNRLVIYFFLKWEIEATYHVLFGC
jgi:hypothetical protein